MIEINRLMTLIVRVLSVGGLRNWMAGSGTIDAAQLTVTQPKAGDEHAPDQSDRSFLLPSNVPSKGKIEIGPKNLTQDWPPPLKTPKGAPNVRIIVGDAYGSKFGSPAPMGDIDRLANSRLRFTDFQITDACAASRAVA